MYLSNKSVAFMQLKGGCGKTTLAGNIASIASVVSDMVTVIVDMDANAPLRANAFGGVQPDHSLIDALQSVQYGEDITDIIVWSEALKSYVLPGSFSPISEELALLIPDMLDAIQNTYVDTNQGSVPVELVIFDTPGDNRVINPILMACVDAVVVPTKLSIQDFSAMSLTLQLINDYRSERDGLPDFLGVVPNGVTTSSASRDLAAHFKALADQDMLLPFIKQSNILQQFLLRTGKNMGETAISTHPKSPITQDLVRLWFAMNRELDEDKSAYVTELFDRLGIADQLEGAS